MINSISPQNKYSFPLKKWYQTLPHIQNKGSYFIHYSILPLILIVFYVTFLIIPNYNNAFAQGKLISIKYYDDDPLPPVNITQRPPSNKPKYYKIKSINRDDDCLPPVQCSLRN